MHKNRGPVYYGDYLKLNQLLGSQEPLSRKYHDECHDEMLFIIVHQVYELWFKQILHEMRVIAKSFAQSTLSNSDLALCCDRLQRIIKIQSLLLEQISVLETMTPMDFLEFRELLIPASGFQSVQFREVEVLMGLGTADRIEVDREFFTGRLSTEDKQKVMAAEQSTSLLHLVENWLERTPFTLNENFDFWKEYIHAVNVMLSEDEATVRANHAALSPKQIEFQLANIAQTRSTFESLFDHTQHVELVSRGARKLSQKAIQNALFIMLYRDEPLLHLPFQFLTALIDIDENFTTWRYRHSLLAQRMLGTKIGTGGSSGHMYLKRAADNNRVYIDLFNLSTFLIPRSKLPVLPADIKAQLHFSV